MKYLALLVLLTGCATTQVRTIENCMTELEQKLKIDSSKLSKEKRFEFEGAVFMFCEDSYYISDLALKKIQYLKEAN